MGDLRAFDLQEYVDHFNCKYYVESGTSEDSIEYALHFPFVRVYSIDPRPETVADIKQRFWYNQRVQVFERTHNAAFYELARIVPNEYSAVVWLTDHYYHQNVEQLATIRPAKKDVLIVDSKNCEQLGDMVYLSKFFGLTHKIKKADLGVTGKGLVLVPINMSLHKHTVL